jgi:hypothetical protein
MSKRDERAHNAAHPVVAVRFPSPVEWQELQREAQRRGMTVSALVRLYVIEGMARHG